MVAGEKHWKDSEHCEHCSWVWLKHFFSINGLQHVETLRNSWKYVYYMSIEGLYFSLYLKVLRFQTKPWKLWKHDNRPTKLSKWIKCMKLLVAYSCFIFIYLVPLRGWCRRHSRVISSNNTPGNTEEVKNYTEFGNECNWNFWVAHST